MYASLIAGPLISARIALGLGVTSPCTCALNPLRRFHLLKAMKAVWSKALEMRRNAASFSSLLTDPQVVGNSEKGVGRLRLRVCYRANCRDRGLDLSAPLQ